MAGTVTLFTVDCSGSIDSFGSIEQISSMGRFSSVRCIVQWGIISFQLTLAKTCQSSCPKQRDTDQVPDLDVMFSPSRSCLLLLIGIRVFKIWRNILWIVVEMVRIRDLGNLV